MSQDIEEVAEEFRSSRSTQADNILLVAQRFDETSKVLEKVERIVSKGEANGILFGELAGADSAIIDSEALSRLEVVIRSRFFKGFDSERSVRRILSSLEEGDLVRVSNPVKSRIYGWCARLLTVVDVGLADSLIKKGTSLGDDESLEVALAFVKAKKGDVASAIEFLANVDSKIYRSAALIIVNNHNGSREAYRWFNGAGLSINDLDPDGKIVALNVCMDIDEWAVALNFVSELSDSDYIAAPALAYLSALVHLAQVVPSEQRHLVLQPPPFDSATFALAGGPADIEHRNKAIELYGKGAEFASQLGLFDVANIASDTALWLALRDSEKKASAIAELEKSMRDDRHSLRRLPLAFQFGLSVDLSAVEREIERQTTLSAGKSTDAAVARLALAFRQGTPNKFLEYIDKHRDQLFGQLNSKAIGFYEVEMLVRSGQLKRARERIEALTSQGLTDIEKIRLVRMVDEATGIDPVEQRLSIYEMSRSLGDLRNLVDALEQKHDWAEVAKYGEMVFNDTRDLSDFERLVSALYSSEDVDRALNLLEDYPIFLQQSEKMKVQKCWILYELGVFSAASELLRELRSKGDCVEYRQLAISIAVTSGDWESLQIYVESEWAARNDRSAEDLLKVAKLAEHIQSPRLKELVYEVARRDSSNPAILLGCYSIATESGWENDAEVFSWLKAAASLSDESGPVQKISLQELFERQPAWERRESETWMLHSEGKLPIAAVASLLNRSFFSMYVLPALANDNLSDVRRRNLIYAFSGARKVITFEPNSIALDSTSLLTLQMLGLTQQVIEAFSEVVIPHGFFRWLFEERQKIPFHQPSKVADANEIRRYVSDGSIRLFEPTTVAASDLLSEVDESLALMLSEVAASRVDGEVNSLVVRSSPVHRVGSLVQEEAELAGYEDCLCSCTSVVQELLNKGILTAAKSEECIAYLSLREQSWANISAIGSVSSLILDDVSVSYFQHLGILQKICRAGFIVYVSARELEEADGLIAYDSQASIIKTLVDDLRIALRNGISSGKIKVDRLIRGGEESESDLNANPSFDLMRLRRPVDLIASDDRFINRYSYADLDTGKVGVVNSIDIVFSIYSKGKISKEELYECLTKLRRFGMLFVPLDSSELKSYLQISRVNEGVLLEGAELRAVRESYLRIVMSDAVQFSQEKIWLEGFLEACIEAMKSLWYEGCDEHSAIVKSDWLLELLDVRKLAHIYKEPHESVIERYSAQVTALMLTPIDLPVGVREMYWKWYENSVLLPIKDNDPPFYSKLVTRAVNIIDIGLRYDPLDAEAFNG
ncbi:PIN domain-containing protein [Ectopseudomonas toyotomiensis]|uniref:HTH domain-containing protein n=1 Tax=Ectopseudomonas toyotomiensis TaxID=554344 RepID=A0AA42LMK5_9GAMM|nr:hypothetical protein [Pseudomonas toyotomiensis]MBG0840962.1 hypothetical protein [Pseudomonas toyotomiensis]MDH0704448.1 hypothetical protein [Pseudomonas toyotomiensis]